MYVLVYGGPSEVKSGLVTAVRFTVEIHNLIPKSVVVNGKTHEIPPEAVAVCDEEGIYNHEGDGFGIQVLKPGTWVTHPQVKCLE